MNNLKTSKIVEAIRKRPGMYVGNINIHGFKVLLGFPLEEAQYTPNAKTKVLFEFKADNWIRIEADNMEIEPYVDAVISLENFDNYANLGLPTIVALSETAHITIHHPTSTIVLFAQKGYFKYQTNPSTNNDRKITIDFKIDEEIFEDLVINYESLTHFLRKYAFLNTNLLITTIDNSNTVKQVNHFDYPHGIAHPLDIKIDEQKYSKTFFRLDLTTKIDDYNYQICFAYLDCWLAQTYILTYGNYEESLFGGSLEVGVLQGIILAVRNYAKQKTAMVDINMKNVKEELILIAKIQGEKLNWYGSTKTKLDMPIIQKQIKQYISEQVLLYLLDNQAIGLEILKKFRKIEQID